MKKVEQLQGYKPVKILADPRRMEILRLVMVQPATLTQLAQILGQSPAWVRHHILALESVNLIELDEVRVTGKVTEKFYRAKAAAFLLQELILPESGTPAVVFSGSHDLAIEKISDDIAKYLTLLSLPVGSLDGLANLRQGLCQVSGAHLLDESGEYNTPFVRHFFPDRSMDLVTLAYRTQGLMFTKDNPKGIQGISNLTQTGLRFINRNPGSGTRLWLDGELKRQNISPENIEGYGRVVNTHTECARAVANGEAEVALGLQASAQQFNLDFIPLLEERYDLVLPQDQEEILAPLLDYIQTRNFRKSASYLTGYTTTHSGDQIKLERM